MTDNDIKEALECCINDECEDCPLYGENHPDVYGNCVQNTKRNALDLINRQQAEVENLKHNLKCVKDHKEGLIERLHKNLDDKCDKCIARDRAEAIKEFAKKLVNEVGTIPLYDFNYVKITKLIGNLVKEMKVVSK
jgi:hypothetical protein